QALVTGFGMRRQTPAAPNPDCHCEEPRTLFRRAFEQAQRLPEQGAGRRSNLVTPAERGPRPRDASRQRYEIDRVRGDRSGFVRRRAWPSLIMTGFAGRRFGVIECRTISTCRYGEKRRG